MPAKPPRRAHITLAASRQDDSHTHAHGGFLPTRLRTIRGKFDAHYLGLRDKFARYSAPMSAELRIGKSLAWNHTHMLLTRFLKDRKAGVAPMLALGLLPLMATVGA